MKSQKKKYSVVIPVYNSENTISKVCTEIKKVFDELEETYEIILVDDYSQDNVWNIMQKLNKANPNIKIIQLVKNYGKHNALLCGFNYVSGNYVITLDDDLQNPPSEIKKLIEKMEATSADVINGQRKKKHESFPKRIASKIFDILFNIIFDKPKEVQFGSMKLIKRQIIEQIIKEKTPNPLVNVLILKNTKKIENIEVEHHRRQHGKSNYNLFKHISIFYDLIINHSTIPLKIIIIWGFIAFFLGGFGLIYIFINSLMGNYTVAGWPSTIMLIIISAGSLQFSIGILGEYIARILNEVSFFEQYKINKMII